MLQITLPDWQQLCRNDTGITHTWRASATKIRKRSVFPGSSSSLSPVSGSHVSVLCFWSGSLTSCAAEISVCDVAKSHGAVSSG